MKPTLAPGIRHKHSLTVTEAMTVPALFRESETFRAMPPVLATGFMIGFMEWACLEAMAPHQESIWLIQTPSDRGHLVLEQERFAGRSGATHKKRDARQAQIPRPRRGGMWRPSGCVATLARCPASRRAARLADRLATCHQRGSILSR